MAVKCLPIEGVTDEPQPKEILRIVYKTLRLQGYDVPYPSAYEAAQHEEPQEGAGVIPTFMGDDSDVCDVIRSGIAFPFNFREIAEKKAGSGRDTGSEHFTSTYNQKGASVKEATEHLINTGQVDRGIAKVEPYCGTGTDPVEVTAYAIATYAKGWVAESRLSQLARFRKGSQSNDEAGQDLYDNEMETWRQVKCVTSRENDYENCLYYQWGCDGKIYWGDDYKDVTAAAIEGDDISKTLCYRTHSSYKRQDGTTYRYNWW